MKNAEIFAERFAVGVEGTRALADYLNGTYGGIWPVSGDMLAVARAGGAEAARARRERRDA